MKKNIIIFFLFTFFGYSQSIISERSTYKSSFYEVSHTIYEQNDSLINSIVGFKNLSDSALLIFKFESTSSYVDDTRALIDYKLWITKYGHFPNNYKFVFYVIYPNEIIKFSKIEEKDFKNLTGLHFLFSWIKLDSISVRKDKERILKSIENKEVQISKKDVTNYFDSGNLVETSIKFEQKVLFKVKQE